MDNSETLQDLDAESLYNFILVKTLNTKSHTAFATRPMSWVPSNPTPQTMTHWILRSLAHVCQLVLLGGYALAVTGSRHQSPYIVYIAGDKPQVAQQMLTVIWEGLARLEPRSRSLPDYRKTFGWSQIIRVVVDKMSVHINGLVMPPAVKAAFDSRRPIDDANAMEIISLLQILEKGTLEPDILLQFYDKWTGLEERYWDSLWEDGIGAYDVSVVIC